MSYILLSVRHETPAFSNVFISRRYRLYIDSQSIFKLLDAFVDIPHQSGYHGTASVESLPVGGNLTRHLQKVFVGDF